MEDKNANPQFSKAHLTNSNLGNFKLVEDMRLQNIASRSLPNIMKIYQAVKKLLVGDTQTETRRQTDR
jgi:hypothetical protein